MTAIVDSTNHLSCRGALVSATNVDDFCAGVGADPILAYSSGAEVNQLQWSTTQSDWVAICFGNKTQILRV